MSTALLELRHVWREYRSGDTSFAALKDVDLRIDAGELVAIVGASGSGKSSLMNILGCLDRPTRGDYRVEGRSTSDLSADDLARLRRRRFGFIFQRYHLLGATSALVNVEVPAVYAGTPRAERRGRARALLERLGLGERTEHTPGQLSGGQQQRVSIARALINGGDVILADEPTGALDRHSGEEVLAILKRLHAEGRTVILVTHDMGVAAHAERIVEIADGRIVSDRVVRERTRALRPPDRPTEAADWRAAVDRLREAFRMAVSALAARRLRTLLTMLGIVIGIASVTGVVALGEGSRQKVLASIGSMGTSTIEIWVGDGWGDPNAAKVPDLRSEDIEALAREPYLVGTSPIVETALQVRRRHVVATATAIGVNEQYFPIMGLTLAQGRAFDAESVTRRAQDIVIDATAHRALFPSEAHPVGQIVMLGSLPCRVVGVLAPSPALNRRPGGGKSLSIYVPYTTVRDRIVGPVRIEALTMRVAPGVSTAAAEHAATHLLKTRRGIGAFYVQNADGIRKAAEATSRTLTVLISSIALISLLVGGIGVMNIMLVSVSERTKEIGVRMAVGARQQDVLQQFLIEAVVVCLLGGVLGVAVALLAGAVLAALSTEIQLVYSGGAMGAAFASALLVGVVFGFLPARNAARLDPVDALVRE